jgi:hypothetical protein
MLRNSSKLTFVGSSALRCRYYFCATLNWSGTILTSETDLLSSTRLGWYLAGKLRRLPAGLYTSAVRLPGEGKPTDYPWFMAVV